MKSPFPWVDSQSFYLQFTMITSISAVSRTIFVAGFIWEERSEDYEKWLTDLYKDQTKGGFARVQNYKLISWLKNPAYYMYPI